jgi:hypothetical protein
MRREQTGVDRYGKPTYASVASELEVIAWAPQVSAEVDGGEVRTLDYGGTLYLHSGSDVRDDDSFVIYDVEYAADGVKALWKHPNGRYAGDVLVVKRKDYVDG